MSKEVVRNTDTSMVTPKRDNLMSGRHVGEDYLGRRLMKMESSYL